MELREIRAFVESDIGRIEKLKIKNQEVIY